ncbi:septation protein SepH [Planctomonas deserti]|uniref:septation protein SepH n=1 Tax=Planctomonas deserti TaxID=2144185 RepID=UPI000D3D8861|nr:septation protein SepH [Planctomonas deserti]
MQDLKVIGVENGALLASSEQGGRFRIPIDEVLQARLRPATSDQQSGRKVPPREIQAQIRAGLSAEEVAAATGAPIEFVRKFEGPVLAEREHIVAQALAVIVHTAIDVDPLSPGTSFGVVMSERLASLGASDERWSSWKDEDGWTVKLEFTADEIDHDARWRYDHRKRSLAPQNNEAVTLSQQGELKGALIPRLRAVTTDGQPSETRFDSGAFRFDGRELAGHDAANTDSLPYGRSAEPRGSVAGRKRTPDGSAPSLNETADLLEALRRRRGEREAAATWEEEHVEPTAASPAGSGIRMVDVPLEDFLEPPAPTRQEPASQRAPMPSPVAPQKASGGTGKSRRGGRAAMPSWDEIVFGARSEEDPA